MAGLLKALGDVQREVHVREYRGTCVGLDAHCFLHKGKYLCAEALLKGQPTTAFLQPLLDVVSMLRSQGVEPFAVFDGGPLPVKREAEQARQRARDLAQWRAGALLRAGGDSSHQQAARHLGSAVGVTPEMAAQGVRRLRELGVRCIVAPCEADAQLAHLALTGRVQACATEDVDLLAFGCERVIFGLNASGFGREIQLADVGKSRGLSPYRVTADALPDLCVLSGCDYLPAIPKLGLKTASQLLHRSRGDVQRAVHLARREGFAVPPDYDRSFLEAKLAYVSQTVFGLAEGRLQPLRPLPPGVEVTPGCLGPAADAVPEELARGVAEGRVHPQTLEPFEGALSGQADRAVAMHPMAGGAGQLVAVDRLAAEPLPSQLAAPRGDFQEVASAIGASQSPEVLRDFRPPRLTASQQELPEAPPRHQQLAGDSPADVAGCLVDGAGSAGDGAAALPDGSAAGVESQAATELATQEGRRPGASPFRPPRLLAGAPPGFAEALDESLAKRRRLGRLGCRVAG